MITTPQTKHTQPDRKQQDVKWLSLDYMYTCGNVTVHLRPAEHQGHQQKNYPVHLCIEEEKNYVNLCRVAYSVQYV